MKRELNKWQFVWQHGRDAMFMGPFIYRFTFGIFKLISMPEEGSRLRKENYKGFLINLRYWFPMELD